MRSNGSLRHTFTGTGRSPSRFATSRTLMISGTDAFTVSCEVSYDDGVTWTAIKEFTATTVESFEWLSDTGLISFNCTVHTSNDVDVVFE